MTWLCPWCGTEWTKQPLDGDVIGCPECGNYRPEPEASAARYDELLDRPRR